MIKRMTLLAKRGDFNRDHFSDYWLNHHGQIPKRMQSVAGYIQNLIIERIPFGGKTTDVFSFDGVVELWFDDQTAQTAAFATAAAKELPLDEPNFIRGITIFAVGEHKMSAVCQRNKVLLVVRSAAVADESLDLSDTVQALCALLPISNLVTANKLGKAGWRENLWHEPMPPDIIFELSFDTKTALAEFARSSLLGALQELVAEKGGAMSCYLVEPRRII